MSNLDGISKKWAKQIDAMFHHQKYVFLPNVIIFKLDREEIKTIFEVGEEKLTMTAFITTRLDPVIKKLEKVYRVITYRQLKDPNSQHKTGWEFKITRWKPTLPEPKKNNFSNSGIFSRFQNTHEINTCTNRQRLVYWKKDHEAFLGGLLCELDKNIRAETLMEKNAIEERLKMLPAN